MNTSHILIADDEACILELLQEEFEGDGYRVSTAANGYEAILMAVTKPCDLLIIDMLMPKLNGIEVITILKKVYPHLPIIAFTGHIGQGYMNETMKLGAVDSVSYGQSHGNGKECPQQNRPGVACGRESTFMRAL